MERHFFLAQLWSRDCLTPKPLGLRVSTSEMAEKWRTTTGNSLYYEIISLVTRRGHRCRQWDGASSDFGRAPRLPPTRGTFPHVVREVYPHLRQSSTHCPSYSGSCQYGCYVLKKVYERRGYYFMQGVRYRVFFTIMLLYTFSLMVVRYCIISLFCTGGQVSCGPWGSHRKIVRPNFTACRRRPPGNLAVIHSLHEQTTTADYP